MKRAWVLGMAALCCALAGADEIAEQGRAVMAEHADAVVTVRVVMQLSISMGGETGFEQEIEDEATGVIIQPGGLTVLSLANTDPSDMMNKMFAGMGGGMMDGMDTRTDIQSLAIILDDGTELDAQIVLRDTDLDLAFLRPLEEPAEPLPFLDMTQSAPLQQLDRYLILYRLGKEAKRTAGASVRRLDAIMEKPRLFYVLGAEVQQGYLGAPAITLDGTPVGLITLRSLAMAGLGSEPEIVLVILPAADVAEAAAQAPEKAPEEDVEPAPADVETTPSAEDEPAANAAVAGQTPAE